MFALTANPAQVCIHVFSRQFSHVILFPFSYAERPRSDLVGVGISASHLQSNGETEQWPEELFKQGIRRSRRRCRHLPSVLRSRRRLHHGEKSQLCRHDQERTLSIVGCDVIIFSRHLIPVRLSLNIMLL